MKTKSKIGMWVVSCALGVLLCSQVLSAAEKVIVVAAEDRPVTRIISQYTPEFEAKTGIKVKYVYYPHDELRAKIRLDAALDTGNFDVIYIGCAVIPEHAASGWVVPIKDYYLPEYDWDDFYGPGAEMLSYEGVEYAAPLVMESDWLMYRGDWFAEAGILPPKSIKEYIEVCQKFFRPSENRYGGALRCLRGAGLNVWRWNQFFIPLGANYMENGEWVFDKYLDEAAEATDYYMQVIATGPPGSNVYSHLESWDGFNAGRFATLLGSTAKYSITEDPAQSAVAGKVSYAATISQKEKVKVAVGNSQGLAITTAGNKTEEEKKMAGQFISWASSKEMEMRRVVERIASTNAARKSSMDSIEMKQGYPADVSQALSDTFKMTRLVIPVIPEWPEIGDYLGIILEEFFAGTRTDIPAGLEDAAANAREVLGL